MGMDYAGGFCGLRANPSDRNPASAMTHIADVLTIQANIAHTPHLLWKRSQERSELSTGKSPGRVSRNGYGTRSPFSPLHAPPHGRHRSVCFRLKSERSHDHAIPNT